MWSDEIRVMFRPYKSYGALSAELAHEPGRFWLAARKPLRWLLIVAAFVSLTAAGRLVFVHLVSATIFWSFFPLLQIAALMVALAVVKRDMPRSKAIDLYFAGQAPWLLLFLAFVGICLFAPRVYDAFRGLLTAGVLPAVLIATIVWSTFLTWVFLRRGLSLGFWRSALGLLVLYGVYGGSLIAYFALTNQIQPLLV